MFTDGDLRRMMLHEHKPMSALFTEDIVDHVTKAPRTGSPEMSVSDAVSLMETANVYNLSVVDGKLLGLPHILAALKYRLGS